jgi:hypothetical protein
MVRHARVRLAVAALALGLAFGTAGTAHAYSVTVGEVMAVGIDDFGFTAGTNTLSFSGAGAGNDELYEMYGYLANLDTGGIVRVINGGAGAGFTVTKGVDTAPAGYSNLRLSNAGATRLGGGLVAGDITMRYSYQLVDDTSAADLDAFRWIIDITNNSAATRNLAFYAYIDLDLQGSAGNDSATGGTGAIQFSDPNGTSFLWGIAGPTNHYQVGPYTGAGSIQTAFNNMITANSAQNLNDTGLPFGPGDVTAALQVNFSLAPGQTLQLTTGVAEPGTAILLAIGLTGLAAWGRPRRRLAAADRPARA